MIDAVAATLLFAVSATCANRSSRMVGGVEANYWRLLLAAGFLGIYAFIWGQGISGQAFGVFFVSGIIGIGVGDFGLFQSFPRLGARHTMLLTLCLTSPMGMLLEWIWMGHGASISEMLCIGAILAGVGITLWPDAKVPISRGNLVPGVLFAFLAAFGGALGAVLSRRAYDICRENQEIIDGPTAAFQRVLGGLLITALIFFVLRLRWDLSRGGKQKLERQWKKLMPWVVGNALAGLTIGVSFMQRALETTRAGLVLAIIATTPVAVIPLARIVDGERISVRAVLGSLLAVSGASGLALVRHGGI